MERHAVRALSLLAVLLLTSLVVPRPALGQQQPVWISPQELYRFRISNSDLGYSLSALYQESIRDGQSYETIIGSIYRPPAGYTPDPASGLVPLHRWTVVEDGWRVYTYHSIYYSTHSSNYTYNGILGYVFPPTRTSHTFESGRVVPLQQMSMWYSQRYGVFNGQGAPGYGYFESPPNLNDADWDYQGVIAAMPPAVAGTRPDFCQPPVASYCFIPELGQDVKFYPPPLPPQDYDGDGFDSVQDCNDSDAWIYPGAPINCESGLDRNCNGSDDWEECDLPSAGKSLSLDGANDYALVNDSDNLSLEGPITVEAWFKVDSTGSYQTIVAKESFQVAGTGGGYELQVTNTGKLRGNFYQSHTTYTVALGTTTVTPGVWHHAAVTFDGTTRRVFLDGALEVSISGTSGGPTAGSGNLRIGRRNSNTNTYYFGGLIDEVRVSNAALYTSNFTPETNLTSTAGITKGLWKFDGGTANDLSGNANNGALQGSASYSTDVPVSSNHSLSLNGTSAYLLVNDSDSLSIEGPITVEAWFKVNSIGSYQTIVAKESFQVAGTGGGYELQVTNTGKIRGNFYQSHTTYTVAAGTTTVTPGVWHHAAITFDGTTRRVFLDGALEVSISGATGGPVAGSGHLRIGRRNSSTNSYHFNGLVDEVRVSNTALYTASFTPQTSFTAGASTEGLWKFNDQTAADTSGNGNSGLLQGGTGFSSDVP